MIAKGLFTRLLILVVLLLAVAACSDVERGTTIASDSGEPQFFARDDTNVMDGGDLCPKPAYTKSHHHFVLIDSTSGLKASQAALVKGLILSDRYLARLAPWDRLSIMSMSPGGKKPSQNVTVFSKCRPRSGNSASIHSIDEIREWDENIADVTSVYDQLFVQGVNDALTEIKKGNGSNASENDPLENSPLMGQVKEIFRLDRLKFNEYEGYKSRKLTIVSDMVQSSQRLDFYKECVRSKKCPTWDKFKNAKKYKNWVKGSMPEIGDNVEIEIAYLNSNFDPQLDKNIIEFWEGFFLDAGTEITEWIFEAEQD